MSRTASSIRCRDKPARTRSPKPGPTSSRSPRLEYSKQTNQSTKLVLAVSREFGITPPGSSLLCAHLGRVPKSDRGIFREAGCLPECVCLVWATEAKVPDVVE